MLKKKKTSRRSCRWNADTTQPIEPPIFHKPHPIFILCTFYSLAYPRQCLARALASGLFIIHSQRGI